MPPRPSERLPVVAARERELGRPVSLASLEGLGWERPFLGVGMWVFMLSLAGFPLTGGFLGKLFVFSAIYEAGWWWLVVIGVLATALSLAYYLNIVRALYMRSGEVSPATVVAAGGSPPRELLLDGGGRRGDRRSRSARSSSSSRSSTSPATPPPRCRCSG